MPSGLWLTGRLVEIVALNVARNRDYLETNDRAGKGINTCSVSIGDLGRKTVSDRGNREGEKRNGLSTSKTKDADWPQN